MAEQQSSRANPEQVAGSDEGEGSEPAEGGSPAEQVQEENRRARRAAAARRRQRRKRELEEARAVGLDPAEMASEALARSSDKLLKWFLRHFKTMQWALVGFAAIWAIYTAYGWYTAKRRANASDLLAQGTEALAGRVVSEETGQSTALPGDPTRQFASEQEQLQAARDAYGKAADALKGSGVAALALLGQAATLLQEGRADDAKALYEQVRQLEVAKASPELSGRALEGTALALEAKGDKAGALASYQELANSGIAGMSDLGRLGAARLLIDEGKHAEGKRLLDEIIAAEAAEAKKPSLFNRPNYTLEQASELRDSLLAKHPELAAVAAPALGTPQAGDLPPPLPPAPAAP